MSSPGRTTFEHVLDGWAKDGPLIHRKSPFTKLNESTGGGPCIGSRWYVLGAPDASKTLLLSLWAHVWSMDGVAVGMLSVDEEPSDVAQRFIQRLGFYRRECEERAPGVLEAMREQISKPRLSVVFYGPEHTIESAGEDLDAYRREIGLTTSALTVDSIQTAECNALRGNAKRDISIRERVTENTKAIRYVSSQYRHITLTTSEMNRAAYSGIAKAEQDDMASAKESGAIEYSARVMLSLRSVKDEDNCLEMRIVKNKHGPRYPGHEPIYLALDAGKQTLVEREVPESVRESALSERIGDSLRCGPKTSEELRKELHVKPARLKAELQSMSASGLASRLNGERSAWQWTGTKSPDGLDPDGDFP